MLDFEFFILFFILALVYVGFYKQDAWIVSFGGICSVILGIYIASTGIADIFNWVSQAVGVILIGFGIYLMIRSAYELFSSKGG